VKLASLKPFRESPEARRLALVFAIVYFAQGMWYLPNLSITFFLKDILGLNAAQTATFFSITVIPWLIKPVYGLISVSSRCLAKDARAIFSSALVWPRRWVSPLV